MPPKQRITREMILDRAFEMFCSEGMEAVNARSVAKALACSTQPIFSYYTGMQDLRSALDLRAQDLFIKEVLEVKTSDTWFIDLCEAFVRFACEHPHVYRHLYESVREDRQRLVALYPLSKQLIEHVSQKESISEETAGMVLARMLVYCAGLCTVTIIGLSNPSNMRSLIEKAYHDTIAAQK